MHFSTLYLLKDEELENTSLQKIELDFGMRFCYACGETTPKYRHWCDCFQIGGRWNDRLIAETGIRGVPSFLTNDAYPIPNGFSICEIKDLIVPVNPESIYAIALKSKIIPYTDERMSYYLYKINNKLIKGVVALVDCHD